MTETTGHTPGPWVRSTGGRCDVRALNRLTGQMIANTLFVRHDCADRERKVSECRANARLIAAAPELLEVAKRVDFVISRMTDIAMEVGCASQSDWDKLTSTEDLYRLQGLLRATIAKAEGKD